MPLYEYRCKACGHVFEKIQSFSAPEVKECPVCKGEVERLLSAPAVQFKGSGWYVTDYAGKSASAKPGVSNSNGSGESPAGSKSESAKSDSAKNGSSAAAATNSSPGSSSGSSSSSAS